MVDQNNVTIFQMKSREWLLKWHECVCFSHSSIQLDAALCCRNRFACVTLVLVITLPNSLHSPLFLVLLSHDFLTEFTTCLVLANVFWVVKFYFNCYSLKSFLVLHLVQSNPHPNSWYFLYLFYNRFIITCALCARRLKYKAKSVLRLMLDLSE